jgi:hypothetical protein
MRRSAAELAAYVCRMRVEKPTGEFAKAFAPTEYHGWTAQEIDQFRHDCVTYVHKTNNRGHKGKANIKLIATFDFYTSRGL